MYGKQHIPRQISFGVLLVLIVILISTPVGAVLNPQERYPLSDRVQTDDATNLSTHTAVLVGQVSPGFPIEVWFEFGSKSNCYGYKTPTVRALGNTVVTSPIKWYPLIAGQTYYFRMACEYGYGDEESFTLPAIAPRETTTYGVAVNQFLNSFEDGDTMVPEIIEAIWSPYMASLGALFWALVIGAVFMNLAMKGHSIAIPTILVLIIGTSLWAFVPPEFVIIAQAFMMLGIAGLLYFIYTKRKL